ncbi:Fibrinogen-like protein A,Ryncolin-4,Angiopoietin-related protein 7,Ficolin-1-B,Ficolin-2,Ryncolin-1,Tenascin-R,Fibrinogen-like protein 1,Tenascin-X,Fibrinogen C domain-containing protein 1-A,Tenascin-N,Ryncolin-3,Tenascin,Fibroleukin,Fibrinogen C domain-containing protein 1,Ryncolin-2,Angiopoietin-related protein 6,Techylectin-5B,Angiopoietin-2,Angiopoietin-related protein 2,Microfibril-associated glycoprotein 4,Ficolin-1-A,Ficolin-1,Fibrinogen C domain-containing protein 1-B [Mytilus coruscus]|uniref:Fibrinogen C-terminal domain-containing protein n=1 Tax=Mytilus coruscus TaxID=42192 RepID=A0A6J8E124_MYTCO|nr:Fibrinogen-like protein A,Ryncolin-4,Angiopoietin-related protein 7,Ficolin-1-B,Ficolin-2,Ryncolin-1,Tenascin-R,Fibrinogen-like protein 1,Tenascin-X,Fibrinogen C domain-containing protein 1-A,Tenascin-N,Ryncolin-3,Tenascin,Fibroleukin,Fibrinogen C domain-containing protein 1,Ryncolin-2,Angiopoietin-related protein 6,Techylectin-5B,Angiopoietin-2,Angiopoietin-related protein 2,Microfibril-associated glycoprotein 4,Ficolin-1-A,Ficolin-1,Fibrinogen C domain-containing protein 1-B [Mytilus coruscus]
MLIYGFALFWLTSVTTVETNSDVEVRLLDNQNAPLMASFDMSKANDRVKQFVSDAIEAKMKGIEKNFNQQIENIERNFTVYFTDYLHGIADKIVKENDKTKVTKLKPRGCEDIIPKRNNGIYTIFPNSNDNGFEVYCDFETDNGNWTVFQRRINGTTDFFRGWEEYENGFGNLKAEFWLGNRKISELTSIGKHELRIDLTDFDGKTGFAKYSTFSVGNGSTNYTLTVDGYSGNLGNTFGLYLNNGMSFTTKDRDNDNWSSGNCANYRNGAWWYAQCGYVNLNGRYLQGGQIDSNGINWYHWKTSWYSMKSSVMMFRKVH